MALQLAADPGKFLSTVQIGITLVGIIAGAYLGGDAGRAGRRTAGRARRARRHAPTTRASRWSIALTTYFSLVVGELVPKQLALRAAMPIAVAMARPMAWLARIAAPFVWLLDSSSNLLLRLLGIRHRGEHRLTAEELHMLFAEATHSGVIEEQERAIMSGIMRLADRPVRELMTPRTELDWLDVARERGRDPRHDRRIARIRCCRSPTARPTRCSGVVKVRDVLGRAARRASRCGSAELMRKAEVVPDQLDAMDALRMLQQSGAAMAMVHDEYGHLEGVVTPADLLRGDRRQLRQPPATKATSRCWSSATTARC